MSQTSFDAIVVGGGPAGATAAAVLAEKGRRVIDKASFQSFGCQTAIAVASMATEMIKGKTPQEALSMSGGDLSAPLGPLPPMKIHCAQLVEGALKNALTGEAAPAPGASAPTLADSLQPKGAVKITFR